MKLRLLLAAVSGVCLLGVSAFTGGRFPGLEGTDRAFLPAAIAEEEEPEPSDEPDAKKDKPAKGSDAEGTEPTPEVKAKKKKPAPDNPDDPPAAGPAEGNATKPAATGATGKTAKKKASLDEQYVLDNIESFLSPTKMEVLPDGRVKLSFDFSQKKEEHEAVFTPRVSKDINNVFRWSLRYEYAGWYGGTSTKADDGNYYYGALRISQQGAAHLNAFFTDDVEAEIQFANGASTSQTQTVAVVYTSGTKSLGSNWGTQAATFESGKLKGRKGAVENAAMDTDVRAKIVVRNGIFEAHRDGRQKQTQNYNPKNYASGKIGFIWGGGLAGFVYKLEITGRLDAKKMADLIRKQRK